MHDQSQPDRQRPWHRWQKGYCLAQILAFLPPGVSASHYRTHAGAEVDLVLEDSHGRVHAIEIKRTLSPKLIPHRPGRGRVCGMPHVGGEEMTSNTRGDTSPEVSRTRRTRGSPGN